MKRTMTLIALGCGAFLAAALASAAEPAFAAKPTAAAEGKGVRIKFAVTARCDVEVTILDASGKEVRHLAAGVVGAKEAAAPLVSGKLVQSLLWDRKDDRGRPVPGKAGKVRVRIGMKPVGAKPILQVTKGRGHRARVTTSPDPKEPGRPGLTAQEVKRRGWPEDNKGWNQGWHVTADREDDRLYAANGNGWSGGWHRYIGATGRAEKFDTSRFLKPGESFRVGPDGELHIGPFRKLTRDLKKVPPLKGVPSRKGSNRFNMALWGRWRASPFHEFWFSAISNSPHEPGLDGKYYLFVANSIPYGHFWVFDTWQRKRALLREGFQPWLSYSSHRKGHFACVRIGTTGRVFIATAGGPKGEKLPDSGIRGCSYGSIVRLNLEGRWAKDIPLPMGAPPKDPEERKKGILWDNGIFIPRVEKCYTGIMSWLWEGCCCRGSTFDIDEYNRLYVPDAGRESVVVMDEAGNEILRVAKKVSSRSDGKGVALHMGWPRRVACTRKAIYFGEDLSKRVIRIGLGYAAKAECALP